MKELIERLRDSARWQLIEGNGDDEIHRSLVEAADAIERLTSHDQFLADANKNWMADCERLTAELAEVKVERDALKLIANEHREGRLANAEIVAALTAERAQKDAGKTLITPGGGAPGDPCGILAAAHTQKDAEPVAWMDMVTVNLVREGINKHKARELANHFYTLPAHDDIPEAVQLLSDVFDAWENGTQCNEEDGNYIGMAFRLDDAVFHRCCDLLNRVNPPRNAHQPDDTALLRQALEAFENVAGKGKLCNAAITALRERLGEQV